MEEIEVTNSHTPFTWFIFYNIT